MKGLRVFGISRGGNIMQVKTRSTETFSIVAIIVFLATSGFPSFLIFKGYIPLLLPFAIYYLVKYNKAKTINAILSFVFLMGVFALIHYTLGHFTIVGLSAFILSMMTLFAVSYVIRDQFVSTFIKVIKFISSISLIIWTLVVLFPFLHNILTNIGNSLPQMLSNEWINNTSNPGVSLYIYYLPTSIDTFYTSFIRNCGPFYEPGLFASYLVLALVFNMIRLQKLFHKENIVFILCLLSTCSSAGYISLILIILFSTTYQQKWYTKVLSYIIIILCLPSVMGLDFMTEKILVNLESASTSSSSRFGAVLYHYEKVLESPWVGYAGGELPITTIDRVLGGGMGNQLSPNGLSFCFVYWGIPLAFLFYIMLYKGLVKLFDNKFDLYHRIFIYIIVLSTAFSQTITIEPIFLLIALFSITRHHGAY